MSTKAPVRIVKRADRAPEKKATGGESGCAIIPPEMAEAIRQFMRREWQRLRRDELFLLRRGMRSELDSIEQELNLK